MVINGLNGHVIDENIKKYEFYLNVIDKKNLIEQISSNKIKTNNKNCNYKITIEFLENNSTLEKELESLKYDLINTPGLTVLSTSMRGFKNYFSRSGQFIKDGEYIENN